MKSIVLKSFIVTAFLAVFILSSLGSTWYDEWFPILSEDFDEVDIIGDMIIADIGFFLIDDLNDVITHQYGGVDGYIVFQDLLGDLSEPSVLEGYPVQDFTKISLLLEFDINAAQTDSTFSASLNDDEDIPIFTCAMGSTGTWQVNGVDTQVAYEADMQYTVSIYVEVDPLGGPTLYAVGVVKTEGQNQTSYEPLDTGLMYNFVFGDILSVVHFSKPASSGVGTFCLDDVHLGYQDVSSRSWLGESMKKNP